MKRNRGSKESVQIAKKGATVRKRAIKPGHCLVVVFDKGAKAQIRRGKYVKRVDDTDWHFDKVRRNKKIQKVLRMRKEGAGTSIPMQLVTSTGAALSNISSVYHRTIIEVLEAPKKFTFRKLDWKWQDFYDITKGDSKKIIMLMDFNALELRSIIPGLRNDVGVFKESVDQLLASRKNDVVAINTHPGHHAGPKKATNYCAINNAIVVVKWLKKRRPQFKVGIIDIDIHPGDGTYAFVKQNQSLVDAYVSIHCKKKFWKSLMNCDLGKHGIALKKDSDGKVAPERFHDSLEKVLKKWDTVKLDVIVVSLGFDTLKCDPLAGSSLGFQLLPHHFEEVGKTFSKRPEQIFFIQEGGYDVNETANAFNYLIKGFRMGRKTFDDAIA